MELGVKICGKCKKSLPAIEFGADKRTKSGLKSYCRSCEREYLRDHTARNREKIREQKKEHRLNHSEQYEISSHRDYRKHRVERLAQAKLWRIDHQEDLRYKYLEKTYGLSKDQYLKMMYTQDQRCAICRCQFQALVVSNSTKITPNVDHTHGSNPVTVRGILCRRCNIGLGKFKDDSELVNKASIYLDRDLSELSLYISQIPEEKFTTRRNWSDNARLKRVCGIHLTAFRKLIQECSSRCYICKVKDDQICADHSHKSGQFRGLLCDSCNTGLGLFGDDLQIVQKTGVYLAKFI